MPTRTKKPVRIEDIPDPTMLTTVYHFILDRSGSMSNVRSAVIDGFNEWLNGLKVDQADFPNNPHLLSFTQFDAVDPNEQVHVLKPVLDVPDLKDFSPRGGTPLYDAACLAIRSTRAKLPSIPGKVAVLVMIMTDGQENSSRTETKETLKKLMEDCESEGRWTFAYMGANQDSFGEVAKFGTVNAVSNTVNWDATEQGTRGVMYSANISTKAYSTAMRGSSGTGDPLAVADFFYATFVVPPKPKRPNRRPSKVTS